MYIAIYSEFILPRSFYPLSRNGHKSKDELFNSKSWFEVFESF